MPAGLTGLSAGINRAAGLAGGALAGVILSAVVGVTGMANFQARLTDLGLAAEQQAGALVAVEALLRSGLSTDVLGRLPGALVTLGLMNAHREARSVAMSSALPHAGLGSRHMTGTAWGKTHEPSRISGRGR